MAVATAWSSIRMLIVDDSEPESSNSNRQKWPRLRLDPESHATLQKRVLQRDCWRYQRCGALQNLEVHHIRFQSFLGDDLEENLITLCNPCHRRHHGSPRAI